MEQRLVLHCVDHDSRTRAELARAVFGLGCHAEVYSSPEELLDHHPRDGIVLARDNPQLGGIAPFIEALAEIGIWLPVIATDSQPTTARIVAAMKAGSLDYLPLPVEVGRLAAMLERIGEEAERRSEARQRMIEARNRIATLSNREREVLEWLAGGSSNKTIARQLDISPRTVEIHRANMMSKLGAKHPADAVRLSFEAGLEAPRAAQRAA